MFLWFLGFDQQAVLGSFYLKLLWNCVVNDKLRFDFFNLDKEWNHLQPDLMQFVEGGALSCQ